MTVSLGAQTFKPLLLLERWSCNPHSVKVASVTTHECLLCPVGNAGNRLTLSLLGQHCGHTQSALRSCTLPAGSDSILCLPHTIQGDLGSGRMERLQNDGVESIRLGTG